MQDASAEIIATSSRINETSLTKGEIIFFLQNGIIQEVKDCVTTKKLMKKKSWDKIRNSNINFDR